MQALRSACATTMRSCADALSRGASVREHLIRRGRFQDLRRHLLAVTVPATATVAEAARVMSDADRCAVVVGGWQGFLTERDLVRFLRRSARPAEATPAELLTARGCSPVELLRAPVSAEATRVDAVMTPRHLTPTVAFETPVRDAVALMRDLGIASLPLVDGECLEGVVSLSDLVADEVPAPVLAAAQPERRIRTKWTYG
mmetsp:Transcript_20103/g.59935  ORF Transcript_20103/g.59935 Transcript_20103/m.59935 type:complete len:201 (+) Transcript_20103:230-832(+)